MTNSAAETPRRPKRFWLSGIALVLMGASISGAFFLQRNGRAANAPEGAPRPEAATGQPRIDSSRYPTAKVSEGTPLGGPPVAGRVGTIETSTMAAFAPLEGRVLRVAVTIGDRVKEGDQLVLVQSGALASLRKEVRAAELSVKTRRVLLDRLEGLTQSRATSLNDLAVAKGDLADAQLSVRANAERLRALGVKLDSDSRYWLTAQKTGVVVQLEAVPGRAVGPDKEKPLFTVADLGKVLIIADVPPAEAARLKVGAPAEITIPGSTKEPLKGEIKTIADAVDPDRQTVPVRIEATNEGGMIRPNSYVDVRFVAGAGEKLVVVPAEAVVTDGSRSVVFVENDAGKYLRRQVTVGHQDGDKVEITAGLKAGEKIVVRRALLLLNALELQGS